MDLDQSMKEKLVAAAKKASRSAYCEYSDFPVGAAVLGKQGEIFAGCNVENASYSLTVCAERNAIFQMVAQGRRAILAVVIYTPTPTPSAPCGACRQVINEFGPDALIISVCEGSEEIRKRLFELMPHAFGPKDVKGKSK